MIHKFMPAIWLIFSFCFSANAQIYSITADGDPSDWEANDGTYDSSSSLAIHGSGFFNGQWIYKGESGDQRTDGDDPDSNYDITEIRIGASSTTLYILIRIDNITDVGFPIVSIAMAESDDPGGFNYIGDGAETGTAGGSHLSNNATNVIDIHDPNNNGADPEFNTGSGFTNRGLAVISTVNNCIEYAIDFTDLNGSISQMSTLNISIISGQDNDTFANNGDAFSDIFESDAIDGMTPGASSGNFFGRAGGVGSGDSNVESAAVPLAMANLLPVEFSSIAVIPTEEGHKIMWKTASETNNAYFEVQRSTISETWKEITRVKGAGTSSAEQSYEAVNPPSTSGRHYYRVKQIDYDGSHSYSPIVSAFWKHITDIQLGPVPVKEVLNIAGLSGIDTPVSLAIYNTAGQKVQEEMYQGTAIDLKTLPDGSYFLQVSTANHLISTKQFTILH